MAMNYEIEAHIRYNADRPKAIANLRALQTQFNSLRDAGVIKELPEDHLAIKLQGEKRAASVPLQIFEKDLRFALQNLSSQISLTSCSLIYFQEVKVRIPNMDQQSPIENAKALQSLLNSIIETLKENQEGFSNSENKFNQNSYEIISQITKGKTNEKIMEDLNISRMTFYRRQKRGILKIMEFLLNES